MENMPRSHPAAHTLPRPLTSHLVNCSMSLRMVSKPFEGGGVPRGGRAGQTLALTNRRAAAPKAWAWSGNSRACKRWAPRVSQTCECSRKAKQGPPLGRWPQPQRPEARMAPVGPLGGQNPPSAPPLGRTESARPASAAARRPAQPPPGHRRSEGAPKGGGVLFFWGGGRGGGRALERVKQAAAGCRGVGGALPRRGGL